MLVVKERRTGASEHLLAWAKPRSLACSPARSGEAGIKEKQPNGDLLPFGCLHGGIILSEDLFDCVTGQSASQLPSGEPAGRSRTNGPPSYVERGRGRLFVANGQ